MGESYGLMPCILITQRVCYSVPSLFINLFVVCIVSFSCHFYTETESNFLSLCLSVCLSVCLTGLPVYSAATYGSDIIDMNADSAFYFGVRAVDTEGYAASIVSFDVAPVSLYSRYCCCFVCLLVGWLFGCLLFV